MIGGRETGFFYENTSSQSTDSVKNPVSLVGVRNSCIIHIDSNRSHSPKNSPHPHKHLPPHR
ncbi:MAG TPA: hypothetical protein DD001_06685 [Microcoleaceae bacterium UBA10368]|nr:hypothetical protein [Microcoleaceae cyanobacterium UBA10368]HCV31270.1 hypothetical protein [Microcoleaceae cyanobacterium UBA9251]